MKQVCLLYKYTHIHIIDICVCVCVCVFWITCKDFFTRHIFCLLSHMSGWRQGVNGANQPSYSLSSTTQRRVEVTWDAFNKSPCRTFGQTCTVDLRSGSSDLVGGVAETKQRAASVTWTKKASSRASARLSWPLSRASCCAELSCPLSMPASSSSFSCFLRQSRQQEVRAPLATSSQRHFTFYSSSSVAQLRRLPRNWI